MSLVASQLSQTYSSHFESRSRVEIRFRSGLDLSFSLCLKTPSAFGKVEQRDLVESLITVLFFFSFLFFFSYKLWPMSFEPPGNLTSVGDLEGASTGEVAFSFTGDWLFSGRAAKLGLASSGVCSLGISGAVVFVVCGAALLLLLTAVAAA